MTTLLSLLAITPFAIAQADTIEPRLLQQPSIHGDTVVFGYGGDLWVSSTTDGAIARRLTSHPGLESRGRISPDGKWVAFTGQYDGGGNIYVIPIEGGEPRRVTFDAEPDNCVGWTPDGKIMYASAAGTPFLGRQANLYIVDPKGGVPTKTVLNEFAEGTFFSDGKTIAYNRVNSFAFNWRRYRGGTQGRVSIYNFQTNEYSELPSKREQSYFPMAVGRSIYYISDKTNGTLNLFKHDLEGNHESQLTKFSDADIKYPNTDGKSIVFQRDGYLYHYDLKTNQSKRLKPRILSENLLARPTLKNLTPNLSAISLSPSGARVVVEARGELFTLPAKNGETRNLTKSSGIRERHPQWSPDGKSIAYISDATGEYEIYTMPQAGGTPTQITSKTGNSWLTIEYSPNGKLLMATTAANDTVLVDLATKKITLLAHWEHWFGAGVQTDWSPDSKWIAYTMPQANLNGALYLYEVATGKSTKVTDGFYRDSSISFDLNGKYLYMVSSRTFQHSPGDFELSLKVGDTERVYMIALNKDVPNPYNLPSDEEGVAKVAPVPPPAGGVTVKIDFDGMSNRVYPLPLPNGNYPGIIGVNNGVLLASPGKLERLDLGAKAKVSVLEGAMGRLAFNPTRTKVAVLGAGVNIIELHPGATMAEGRVDSSGVEAVINPRDEWRQIFWDAWRWERDFFYDPKFGGVDWDAVGKRYAQYLQHVYSRQDLNYLLGLMLGELGTGHSYVSGGDFGPAARPNVVGHLGADYETLGGKVRFKKIYRGWAYDEERRGPLYDYSLGVKEGDYLLEIDGEKLDANTHPGQLMLNKVGRTVALLVNDKPTEIGARIVRVKPIASEIMVRYTEWLEDNTKKVAKLSNGRIGYMHIRNTATEGMIDFTRGYWGQSDKDAMLIDERWNGGGYIQPWFVDTLNRKIHAGIQRRAGADATDLVAIEGPMALLINGYAGSGGDFFPWTFRQTKVGPLIGKRTWGGLVGIQGNAPLVDGGGVTAPGFAIFDRATGEIIAENTGVAPDIDVDNRPDLVAKGQDPQLEKAVEYLLEQLKKWPGRPTRKGFPQVGKDGKIGN